MDTSTTATLANKDEQQRRRVRRIAGAVIAFTGLLNLQSAMTPPLRGRLEVIRDLFPMSVAQSASAIVAASGIALLLLSRGVRRGQRHAWALAVALAAISCVLHVLKGLDVEEAALAGAVAGYLVHNRRWFRVAHDKPSVGRALSLLATGAVVAIATGTATALWLPRPSHLSVGRALLAVSERLIGMDGIRIPGRRDHFLVPTLGAVGLTLGIAAGWLVFRPVVRHVRSAANDWGRARDIVVRYGTDTLSYFALRDDKQHWLWHNTLIAYAVINGVCLVSPDPVGPVEERADAWRAFRAEADAHGWSVAVMAASEEWLPLYRESGMKDLYIGDEAIVDVPTFSLEGGKRKGLRQAVNRIAKYGYTIEFHDPAHLTPALEASLRALMTESRRGDVERGFSMTLGRVFAPDDEGLLLAVCFGPDGTPAAFCQYVPSPGIEGWSLDLMRRSDCGEHPNGLTDFVVVRTIEHMRERGERGLGLNFSVMRAVLAEDDPHLGQRLERRVLGWLSESMQIESLWKYNAKFDPTWLARYACYDSLESFLPAALAVAKAESFWELPLIGRFLTPAVEESASREPVGV